MKTKMIFILLILVTVSINVPARYYDPDTGRFTTADSVTPCGGANSQRLNRYSYCMNNPVKYMDPSGHAGEVAGFFKGAWNQIKNIGVYFYYNATEMGLGEKMYKLSQSPVEEQKRQFKIIEDFIRNPVGSTINDTKAEIEGIKEQFEKNPSEASGAMTVNVAALALSIYTTYKVTLPKSVKTPVNIKEPTVESIKKEISTPEPVQPQKVSTFEEKMRREFLPGEIEDISRLSLDLSMISALNRLKDIQIIEMLQTSKPVFTQAVNDALSYVQANRNLVKGVNVVDKTILSTVREITPRDIIQIGLDVVRDRQ